MGHEIFVNSSSRIIAIGDNIRASRSNNMIMMGSGLYANAIERTIITGTYNKYRFGYDNTYTPAIMVVGNGTPDSTRDDAFVMYGEGTVNLTDISSRLNTQQLEMSNLVLLNYAALTLRYFPAALLLNYPPLRQLLALVRF